MRHSVLGVLARSSLELIHDLIYRDGRPRRYDVSPEVSVKLYPKGELSKLLVAGPLFEREEIRLVARLLKPGMRVIDVGANIGLYSLTAAHRVGPQGRVWCFEPSRETFDMLSDNLRLNQVGNVSANQLALADAEGQLALRSDPGFGDLYRHLDYGARAEAANHVESVRAVTLDAFAEAEDIGEIDLLKVDVEGAELRVFRGAQRLLSRSPRAVVMFENEEDWCRRAGCRPEDSLELLAALGFQLYSWSKRAHSWSRLASSARGSRTVWAARNPDLLP